MNLVREAVRIDKASFTKVFLDKIKGKKNSILCSMVKGKTSKNLSRKTVDCINDALQNSVRRTHNTWVQSRELSKSQPEGNQTNSYKTFLTEAKLVIRFKCFFSNC